MYKKFKRATSMILLFVLAISLSGCTLPGLGMDRKESDSVVITSGTTTEMQVLGYMLSEMIEYHTDVRTRMINNLGSSVLNHQALIRGDADIAGVKYTGTEITGVLNMDPETDSDKAMEIVSREYDKLFDMKWYESYGFSNTYAFMVTKEFSDKHDVKKISDLKKLENDITVGVDTSWMNREGDGYNEFKDAYGIDFRRVYPMQIGLVYDALKANKMDLVLGYSTDGRISSYNLVVLEDDLKFFPAYDAAAVVKKKVLREHPEIDKVISVLEGQITPEIMRELNYKSDNNLIEPQNVAKEFLKENNYFAKELE